MEKLQQLLKLIKHFLDTKKSVQIRINLHGGNLSEKVEVKETHHLEWEGGEMLFLSRLLEDLFDGISEFFNRVSCFFHNIYAELYNRKVRKKWYPDYEKQLSESKAFKDFDKQIFDALLK